MKIAVVGSGISGLSAAYYLSKKHHVDLFEKEDHFGGHSHTIDLMFGEKKVSVDIGFIVFNFQTYPNLIKFFLKKIKLILKKVICLFQFQLTTQILNTVEKGLAEFFLIDQTCLM